MKMFRYLVSLILIYFCTSGVLAHASQQLGAGYGKQFRNNKDLEQYELFFRQPLSFSTVLKDRLKISSALEFGVALLQEAHSDNIRTPKFSMQPQIIVTPFEKINFIFGLGAGYMPWDTEFTKHDLGGEFFLYSKLGIQLLFRESWGVEYMYYHQSNGHLYEHNASLNMHHFSVVYLF